MPDVLMTCSRCGRGQYRHHNARKCVVSDCGGALIGHRPVDEWIQTYTGRAFWPLAPRPEDIDLADIAHALALKCRFTGHVREHYSVAEHSVHVSRLVPPEDAFWGLLHDASEAYLPDVARPVKPRMIGFRRIEDRVMRAIAKRFGLRWPMPASVHKADLVALRTERRDLMAEPPMPWKTDEAIEPDPETIVPIGQARAEHVFLHRFQELA